MAPRFIDKQYESWLFVLLFCLNVAVLHAESSIDKSTKGGGAAVDCDENGDCLSDVSNCHKICGCDRSAYVAVYYNETSKSCVVSFKHLMKSEITIYGNGQEDPENAQADLMAEKIREEAERIFNTILVSAILFISCSAVCVISACLYCCRISYADYRLGSDVKALAKKLKRDHKLIKKPTKKPTEPAQESCNVICAEADVFVV